MKSAALSLPGVELAPPLRTVLLQLFEHQRLQMLIHVEHPGDAHVRNESGLHPVQQRRGNDGARGFSWGVQVSRNSAQVVATSPVASTKTKNKKNSH